MVNNNEIKYVIFFVAIIVTGTSLGFLEFSFLFNSFPNDETHVIGWTWVGGNCYMNFIGHSTGIGDPNPLGYPGSRSGASSWIDSNNILWYFGGMGCGEFDTTGFLNDLWKFNGTNWIWMSGNRNLNEKGYYGTKGIPSASSNPGGRYHAISWKDSDENFWLFGGIGFDGSGSFGFLNDLWKFNGTYWTWVSGNKTINLNGVYGVKGDPDLSNYPGSRDYAISWMDSDDNLWLFGGNGYPESGAFGLLNDLWKFDGTNWTWISGNKTIDQYGVYGTKGFPDAANYPGGRNGTISWVDSNTDLWLFGGYGYGESGGLGYLNDLWKFNGSIWVWISGHNIKDLNGVYGTKTIPYMANYPGSRYGASSWTDSDDILWLFGGEGYPEIGEIGYLNDLWKFNGTDWTWMSGNKKINIYGLYGMITIPTEATNPGSRKDAASLLDSNDNLWLFGGYGYPQYTDPEILDEYSGVRIYEAPGLLNDLWMYNIK